MLRVAVVFMARTRKAKRRAKIMAATAKRTTPSGGAEPACAAACEPDDKDLLATLEAPEACEPPPAPPPPNLDRDEASFILGAPVLASSEAVVEAVEEEAPLACAFNPFGGDGDEDVPFDVPEPADYAPQAPGADAAEAPPREPAVAAPTKPKPPPQPALTPIPPLTYKASRENQPGERAYLASARISALQQARYKNAPQRSPVLQSVALGLAMPFLLGGVWALSAPVGTEAQPMPRAAEAAPAPAPKPAEPDRQADYQNARREIAAGRVEAELIPLRRAAEHGHALAQYRLSKLYEAGQGVERNLQTALRWAERAAEAGNCRAMHDVGVFYAQGEGGAHDEAAAFRWFRQAAEFGVADSQFNLGVLYQSGRGVSQNAPEALFWFLVAARHGEINAADRAVEVAATMPPVDIEPIRARARAFQARAPLADANAETLE